MKCIFFLISFIVSSSVLYAQQNQAPRLNPQEHAQNTVDKITEKIIIPSEKKDSLVMAFKTYYEDLNKYRSQGNEKLVHAIMQSRDAKVKKILSKPEDFSAYQKYIEEQKAQRAQHQGGGGHGGKGRRGGGGNGGF